TARLQLQAGHEAPLPEALSRFRGLPVLVVDDNATSRRIVGGQLAGLGFQPTEAADVAAALQQMARAQEQQAPYPLLLVSAGMPEIDGFALVRYMSESRTAAAVIMMLSSADWQTDVGRCRELGIPAHLTKPAKKSELIKAVLT